MSTYEIIICSQPDSIELETKRKREHVQWKFKERILNTNQNQEDPFVNMGRAMHSLFSLVEAVKRAIHRENLLKCSGQKRRLNQ